MKQSRFNASAGRSLSAAVAVTCGSLAVGSAAPAWATDWADPAGGSWATATNWSAGVPTVNTTANFNTGSGTAYTVTNADQCGSFNVGSGAVTLAGGVNVDTAGANPISTGVTVGGAGQPAVLAVVGPANASSGGLNCYTGWPVAAGSLLDVRGGNNEAYRNAIAVTGTFNLSGGGTLFSPDLYVNGTAGSVAATTSVFGASAVTLQGTLGVGSSPGTVGTLNLTAGSRLGYSGGLDAYVGAGPAAVTGGAPTAGGVAGVSVDNGGLGAATLTVGAGAAGVGSITLTNAATLNTGSTTTFGTAGGTGTLTESGAATALLSQANITTFGDVGTGRATLTGGAALTVGTDLAVGIRGGTGSVALSWAGTRLTTPGLEVGARLLLTVNNGVYTLAPTASGVGVVRLDTGAAAAIAATVGPPATGVTLFPGGTLQLASAATLTDTGTYNQSAGGELDLGLSSANLTAYPLTVARAATLAGTLGTGFYPYAGQKFDLVALSGGETGTFSTVSLAPPGVGLTWDTSSCTRPARSRPSRSRRRPAWPPSPPAP